VAHAIEALARFRNARRRLELRGTVAGVSVYDDFAHHPTAIAATIEALRGRVGGARILAVLEPRSATMKLGVHRDTLGASLAGADATFLYAPPDLGWDVGAAVHTLGDRAEVLTGIESLATAVLAAARAGDHVLVMSNGGFGGLHGRLLAGLGERAA
jgi:UDP-N-acetylmuramate: L-alanyl-gamma-D-glutamyl-meso-diaminopimelate ligase